jgi:predicted GNAT family acetyltransferase
VNRKICKVSKIFIDFVFYIYRMYDEIPLINNEAIHNFEFIVDGHRAFIDYKQHGDKVFLIHTEVPVELEGKGVASAMVEKIFKYLEANSLKIVPYCPYIKVFLKKHPEWERLLA